MRVAIVAGFIAGFLAVLAAFVVLALNGKDTSSLMLFVSGAAASIVPQMFTLLKAHTTQQAMNAIKGDVAEVKERTNGPLTQMQEQVNEIATRIVDDRNEKEGT